MKRIAIGLSIFFVLMIALGVQAVLTPEEADSPVGDAIVVHDGGHGERLSSGLALAANGAAPVLVVMNGETIDWPNGQNLCDQTEPFIVVCPTPAPSNTSGEAGEIRDYLDEQQWSRLVIVTSDYHLHRALMLDEACADGAVLLGVGAPADISTTRRVLLIMREVAALPHAWLSGCR